MNDWQWVSVIIFVIEWWLVSNTIFDIVERFSGDFNIVTDLIQQRLKVKFISFAKIINKPQNY